MPGTVTLKRGAYQMLSKLSVIFSASLVQSLREEIPRIIV